MSNNRQLPNFTGWAAYLFLGAVIVGGAWVIFLINGATSCVTDFSFFGGVGLLCLALLVGFLGAARMVKSQNRIQAILAVLAGISSVVVILLAAWVVYVVLAVLSLGVIFPGQCPVLVGS